MLLVERFLALKLPIIEPLHEKTGFCLCENKDADKLCINCTADQRLCFRYSDSIILLLFKSESPTFYFISESVQVGLCDTWSEIPKPVFFASRLNYNQFSIHCSTIGLIWDGFIRNCACTWAYAQSKSIRSDRVS